MMVNKETITLEENPLNRIKKRSWVVRPQPALTNETTVKVMPFQKAEGVGVQTIQ
jgi:hypothetical protein